jgi:hypothetical protein
MKTQEMLISPKIAAEILKNNPMNRRIKDYVVEDYARQMSAGLWREDTAEAIQIATDGELLNGQQRLTALIKANVTLKFTVATDCDKEIFKFLDQHAKRTPGDVFYCAGIASSINVAAGIKRYFNLKRGGHDLLKSRSAQISPSEALSLYASRNKYWDAANNMCSVWYSKCQRMLTHSEILGLYSFFFDINEDDAFLFMDSLCNGDDLKIKSPIKQLREKLIFSKINKKFNLTNLQRTALIFKSWNLFRTGESVKFLKYTPETDNYPIAV